MDCFGFGLGRGRGRGEANEDRGVSFVNPLFTFNLTIDKYSISISIYYHQHNNNNNNNNKLSLAHIHPWVGAKQCGCGMWKMEMEAPEQYRRRHSQAGNRKLSDFWTGIADSFSWLYQIMPTTHYDTLGVSNRRHSGQMSSDSQVTKMDLSLKKSWLRQRPLRIYALTLCLLVRTCDSRPRRFSRTWR